MRRRITPAATYTTLTHFRNDIIQQLDASNYIWPRVGTWGWAKTRTKLAFELVQDMYNGGLGGPILTNPPYPSAQSTPAPGASLQQRDAQSTLSTGASIQSPRAQPIPAPEAALQQRHEHSTLVEQPHSSSAKCSQHLIQAPHSSPHQEHHEGSDLQMYLNSHRINVPLNR
jgi:hypothetical protein